MFKRFICGSTGTARLTLSAMLVSAALATPLAAQDAEPFRLTLMHTNDTHSHHEPQGRTGNGGAARQATVVKSIRSQVENLSLIHI